MKLKTTITNLGTLKEIALLIGLAMVIYGLVLRFIFPGYFNPAWPNHSDYYISAALAHSVSGFGDIIFEPRPVGFAFFKATGYLGIRGGIFAVIAVVLLNCVVTAALFRRVALIEMGWRFLLGFIAYVFLVFAHPYFHVFSTYDAFSQISYLLLIAAAWCLFQHNTVPRLGLIVAATVLALLAFLAKETYGLSALILAAAWFLAKRQDGALRAAIPTISISAMLGSSLLINAMNGSPFTGGAKIGGSPYEIVLAPVRLLTEWSRYAAETFNAASTGLLLLLAFSTFILLRLTGIRRWLALLLPVAGALAWLPNACLPNHYMSGYSWNGAYLLYAPLLFVVPLWQAGRLFRFCSVVIIALALGSPLLFDRAYKSNAWVLEQESRQRNLLQALGNITATLPNGGGVGRILITGINFTFSPFDHVMSMRSFPHMENIQLDVLAYAHRTAAPDLWGDPRDPSVRFIPPSEVVLSHYNHVWAFRSDGTLAKNVSEPGRFTSYSNAELGFSAAELLIYPNLFGIFGDPSVQYFGRKPLGGYQYLECGGALLVYENLSGAEKCLTQSVRLIPDNPYPYFYLGQIHEKRGLFELAIASYEKAVAADNPKSPNPAFKNALERVRKGVPTPTE
jgi:tetratricopeptide (TPR) repeat protein